MPDKKSDTLAEDLLHGAAEIGAFLGINERAVFYQISNGEIPVVRMGRLIVASKNALRRRFIPEAKASQ